MAAIFFVHRERQGIATEDSIRATKRSTSEEPRRRMASRQAMSTDLDKESSATNGPTRSSSSSAAFPCRSDLATFGASRPRPMIMAAALSSFPTSSFSCSSVGRSIFSKWSSANFPLRDRSSRGTRCHSPKELATAKDWQRGVSSRTTST